MSTSDFKIYVSKIPCVSMFALLCLLMELSSWI